MFPYYFIVVLIVPHCKTYRLYYWFDFAPHQMFSKFFFGWFGVNITIFSKSKILIYQYFRFGKYGDVDPEPTKKEFAEHLVRCEVKPIVKAICFAMWDNKDYNKIIWKHIKPEFRKL